MANYVYARDDQAGRYIVRGKVQEAVAYFWIENRLIRSKDIPKPLYPAQVNNMTMWFIMAHRTLRDPLLDRVHHMCIDKEDPTIVRVEYLINDGTGAKSGKGSNENKFTYKYLLTDVEEEELRLDNVRIEVIVKCIGHQQLSNERTKQRMIDAKIAAAQAMVERGQRKTKDK